MKYRLLILLTALLIALAIFSSSAFALDASAMYNLFMSPDWCGKSLVECTGAPSQKMRDQISVQVAEGWTRQQIVDYWVGVYGPRVLAAPPKQGFFWIAWVFPFVVLGAGAFLLMTFFNPSKHRKAVDKSFPLEHEQDGLLQERLDMEIRKRI